MSLHHPPARERRGLVPPMESCAPTCCSVPLSKAGSINNLPTVPFRIQTPTGYLFILAPCRIKAADSSLSCRQTLNLLSGCCTRLHVLFQHSSSAGCFPPLLALISSLSCRAAWVPSRQHGISFDVCPSSPTSVCSSACSNSKAFSFIHS